MPAALLRVDHEVTEKQARTQRAKPVALLQCYVLKQATIISKQQESCADVTRNPPSAQAAAAAMATSAFQG